MSGPTNFLIWDILIWIDGVLTAKTERSDRRALTTPVIVGGVAVAALLIAAIIFATATDLFSNEGVLIIAFGVILSLMVLVYLALYRLRKYEQKYGPYKRGTSNSLSDGDGA